MNTPIPDLIPAEQVVAHEWVKFMTYLVMKLGGEIECNVPVMVKEFEVRKGGTNLACIGNNEGIILRVVNDEEAKQLLELARATREGLRS